MHGIAPLRPRRRIFGARPRRTGSRSRTRCAPRGGRRPPPEPNPLPKWFGSVGAKAPCRTRTHRRSLVKARPDGARPRGTGTALAPAGRRRRCIWRWCRARGRNLKRPPSLRHPPASLLELSSVPGSGWHRPTCPFLSPVFCRTLDMASSTCAVGCVCVRLRARARARAFACACARVFVARLRRCQPWQRDCSTTAGSGRQARDPARQPEAVAAPAGGLEPSPRAATLRQRRRRRRPQPSWQRVWRRLRAGPESPPRVSARIGLGPAGSCRRPPSLQTWSCRPLAPGPA